MSNLIGGNTNDIIKSAAINNALLSKKNASTQKSLLKTPKLTVNNNDNNVNPNVATQVTITNLQGLSQYLGLYNSKGVVPVVSVNKADEEIKAKASTNDSHKISYEVKPSINSMHSDSKWTKNTIVNGALVAAGGEVQVDILNSDSGYDNNIYWSTDNFQTKNYLGVDNQVASYNLGSFSSGTQIKFGIDNGVDGFYQTGSASENPDNYQHAKFTQTTEGTEIGFEDLSGGGDQDFNDAVIQVSNVKESQQTTSKEEQSKLENELNARQNNVKSQVPVEEAHNSNSDLSTVIKDSALKVLANKKAINEGELHKTLFASFQSNYVQSEKNQNKLADLNSSKKINDNLTTLDYFNKKFTLDNFNQVNNERNINDAQKVESSNKHRSVTVKNENRYAQLNDINDEFSKDRSLLLNKRVDNANLAQEDKANQEQNTINNRNSNQEVVGFGNKSGTSTAVKLLNNFLHKNIN